MKEVSDNIQMNTDGDSDYSHLSVADIARDIVVPILEKKKWTDRQIEEFQNASYGTKTFGLRNFPLLTKFIPNEERPDRCLAKPIVHINNEEYYLCSEWYEKPIGNPNDDDRPFLLKWISLNK